MLADLKKLGLRNFVVTRMPAWSHPPLRQIEMAALTAGGNLLRHLPSDTRPHYSVLTAEAYVRHRPDRGYYQQIYPEEAVVRPVPKWSGAPRLDGAFATELKRVLPPSGVGVIYNGRVVTTMGAVITPDGGLIEDVSHTSHGSNPYSHPLFTRWHMPELRRVAGRVAVITTYFGNLPGRIYYGHWIFDMLPRLHLLERSGIRCDLLITPAATKYQRESLRLLGIENIFAEQNVQIQADEVVVPSLAGFPVGNYSHWAIKWLRDRFLPMTPPMQSDQPRRLYISRNRAPTRLVLNEEELLSVLTGLGFQRVYLEDYSFLDGVRLCRDAEVIVSAHGSNITNMVFCQPGTPVVEMFSPHWVAAPHFAAACQAGLNYGYVVGEGKPGPGRRLSENMTIDPHKLLDVLRQLGAV